MTCASSFVGRGWWTVLASCHASVPTMRRKDGVLPGAPSRIDVPSSEMLKGRAVEKA